MNKISENIETMNTDNNEVEYIFPDESLDNLVRRGILPKWIAYDADLHGMSEAENILCEWDWEWGWDLGDGYTSGQLDVLKQVRERIARGITNFESNPALVAKRKEAEKKARIRHDKKQEYKKKFAYQYVDRDDIDWLLDFEEQFGELPFLHLVCHKTLHHTRTDSQKAQLLRIGVTNERPMSPEEVKGKFPEIKIEKLKELPYKNWTLQQTYLEVVAKMLEQMPDILPDASDPFWQNLIGNQRLDKLGLSPMCLYRLVTFFRLNTLTIPQRKKLSSGIY